LVDAVKITDTFRVRSMSMGIKRILLKLVDDIPEDTLPTHSQNEQVQFLAFTYQAIGFASVLDNGIEISMGFDKST
jgi:hypothetical protein